jgi:lipopolysaccharide/colanic/teichoic acid biosynthesis glycosyltransferase
MVRRLSDILLAGAALLGLAPLFLLAGAGIRLSSPGPVFYRARRAGLNGRPFTMLKFRTMHVGGAGDSRITSSRDARVFRVGHWLRATKIDELPQLISVVKGDMSIVGPRPEDLHIVEAHYTPAQRVTLSVNPGLASPGSLYNYTHGELFLDAPDPERAYAERLLPIKLALDTVYVRRRSMVYDLRLIARTIWIIIARTSGRRRFADPVEMHEAHALLHGQSSIAAH